MKRSARNRAGKSNPFPAWTKNFLLLLVSVALVLLGAEVFVRYYDPQMLSFPDSRKNFVPPIYRANERWLVELRPGTVYEHNSPYGDFRATVRVNREGFRGKEIQARKPAGRFRIFFLGDSFTFGLGVSDGETFAARLETLLNAQAGTGRRFEVINGGVPGYNLAHYYLVLKHRVFRYDPDLILLGLLPWNDFDLAKQDWVDVADGLPGALRQDLYVDAEGRVRLRGEDILRPKSVSFNVLPASVKEFLRANSHLYHFLGERLYRLRKNMGSASWAGRAEAAELTEEGLRRQGLDPEAIETKLREQRRENWRKGMRLLEAVVRMSRQRRVPFAVLLVPHLYESHYEYLTPKFVSVRGGDPGVELLRWLKERKVPYLDLVRELDPYDEKRIYLKYDKHFTPLGHDLTARFLHAFLSENNLVPSGRGTAAGMEINDSGHHSIRKTHL
ncbi:MAG: hypothetical protein ACE5JS_11555 [Nitrospinota bacterium]